MEIPLKPKYETMIRERVEYLSPSEVVEEGVRLLARHEAFEKLKQDVQVGLDQLDSGEYFEYDSGADVLADVIATGNRRLAQ